MAGHSYMLSGVLCGLTVLPLEPPNPIRAALIVGLIVVIAATLLFDPRGRDILLLKADLWVRGWLQMVVGKDKKWKKKGRPDPAEVSRAPDRRSKRIIFIRHGESEWNLIFNIGPKVLVPFKLVRAIVRETLMWLYVDPGSILYDSPLNEEGLKQARDLDEILVQWDETHPNAADVSALLSRSNEGLTSVVCSSNLRRAAQTMALALKTRFERDCDEKAHLLSSLQEISTNVDTLSVTAAHCAPVLPHVPEHLAGVARWDLSANSGNKLLLGNGLQRMQAFNEWAFKRDEDVIVAAGHSLYYRSFFREFLPVGSNPFDSRDSKIANGGVVALTLERGFVPAIDEAHPGGVQYRIVPESIVEVHLGFDTKAKRDAAKKATKANKSH